MILALLGAALAAEPAVDTKVAGDVKTFFLGVFPYEDQLSYSNPFDPLALADPSGSGILSLRLKSEVEAAQGEKSLRLIVHLASSGSVPGAATSAESASVGPTASVAVVDEATTSVVNWGASVSESSTVATIVESSGSPSA